MAIRYISGDVKCHAEPGRHQAEEEEAGKVYFVEIFRVEEQIGDAQQFAKAACNHRKQDYPT